MARLGKALFRWQVILAASLVLASGLLFFVHYLIFRDSRDLFFYLLHGIALIPINVLIVSLLIDQILNRRDKQDKLKKLNMVIGAFYSEAGHRLLSLFSGLDRGLPDVQRTLAITTQWDEADYKRAWKTVAAFSFTLSAANQDLIRLKSFLAEKRAFLLGLLENPNLLEHDSFTDLLWAVFHLTEELAYRVDLEKTTETDRQHLEGDIRRAYLKLIEEWLYFMRHLRRDYPYLYSLAIRLNPLNPDARAEIR